MYKFYVIPDATKLASHSEVYSAQNMKLFWDPRSESSSYAILEAKIKNELNKAGSLEFSLLPTNIRYNDFHKKKSVVLVYDDNDLMFEGMVSANPSDFYKQRRVTCIGTLAYLVDSIQAPDEKNETVAPESINGTMYIQVPLIWYEGLNPNSEQWYERQTNDSGEFVYTLSEDTAANPSKVYYYASSSSGTNISGTTITRKAATKETINDHIARLLDVHNAQVNPFKQISIGQINSEDSEVHEFSSTGWRTTWESLNSDILEGYGKYFTVTTSGNGSLSLNYLNIAQMSSATPVVEYARNMLEMTEAEENNDNIFTVLVPIGKNNLTVEKATGPTTGGDNEIDPYIATFGEQKRYVVVSKAAIARYGYIVKTQTFSDISNADDLYGKAVQYIKNNYDYHKEYDVKAIDLKVIGESDHRIQVGDKCRVLSKWHGVDERDLYVISAEIDPINPENDTFKIGVPTQDREAGNRRITGQLNNNRSKTSSNASNYASGMSSVSSALENVIHVTEWGLEMNSNLRNIMETNDGKYKTQFEQTGEHVALTAEKLFGVVGEEDSKGFVLIPLSDLAGKNPKQEGWYEYGYDRTLKKNCYMLTEDTTPVSGKNYYTAGLWKRVSEVEVDEGGIHGRVQGNYKTATAIASWIEANEDAILAITGHIHVDENGQVIIDSGAGARTGHTETRNETKYYKVPKSWYFKSPSGEGWYEQKTNGAGTWTGEGKAVPDGSDFVLSKDSSADPKKYYYYKNTTTEEFYAEYGIYNEGNLTGGVIARAINHPNYKEVPRHLITPSSNPSQNGWYEYNPETDSFGLSLATSPDFNKKYYTVENNFSDVETTIKGDRVIVGWNEDYSGLDDATKARVNKYIHNHNLDGTITEVASDVLYAKAIISNYINVLSTKLFGESNDDSDFVVVKAAGVSSSKNPSENGWYEYNAETGKYFLSADTNAVTSKTYYITKLTSRTTDFEAGEGGLQATIKGNYDRSIASQAWIKANEEKLEMLLGHVGEDENGNLVIDSGAGFKTGHSAASTVTPRYVLVQRSQYSGANPSALGWKERKIGTDGRWIGAGKADSDTNASYYVTTSDTSADYTKQYFIRSTTAETYISEYGIYDQGNLTAGVVAQMVNNPKYRAIERKYQSANVNPSTASSVKLSNGSTVNSMWYVYDPDYGTYGRTTDTSLVPGRVYYYVQNDTSTYTDLKGEHIVIGASDGYDGLNNATKAKVNKYIHNHNLDGTITEIASDVVVVNSLIAKYIEADEIIANTYLRSDLLNATRIVAENYVSAGNRMVAPDFWISSNPDRDPTEANSIKHGLLSVTAGPNADDKNISITATTSGDTVTISLWTMDSRKHSVSFDKPASLGTVTWSSGERLTVKTAGGKTFFEADLQIPKAYSSSEMTYVKDVNGNIAPTTFLRDRHILYGTMNVSGTWTGETHDPEDDDPIVWSDTIYIDATKAFDAGKIEGIADAKSKFRLHGPTIAVPSGQAEAETITNAQVLSPSTAYKVYNTYDNTLFGSTIYFKTPAGYSDGYSAAVRTFRTYSNWAVTDNGIVTLGYSGSASVYGQYKAEGASAYKNLAGVLVKSPSKGSFRTYASYNNTEYTSGSISLGSGDSVTVYGQRKMDGDNDYESAAGITITSQSVSGAGSVKTYYERLNSDDEWEGTSLTAAASVTLGYNESVKVNGRYLDASNNATNAYILTVTSPSKPILSMRSKATYPATGDSAHTYYGDDNDNWQVYMAGSGYVDVFPEAKQGDDSYSSNNNYVRIHAPSLTMRSRATYPASGDNAHTYYGDDNENFQIRLNYGDQIDVYPEAKQGDDAYDTTSNNYVRIFAPGAGSVKTYYDRLNSDDEWEGTTIDSDSSLTLGYSESVVIKGRYQDAFGNWTSGPNLTVTAPASNSTSHSINIPTAQIYTSDTSRGTKLTTLKSKYEAAKADGDYVMFRVDCGGTTKWYYMEP